MQLIHRQPKQLISPTREGGQRVRTVYRAPPPEQDCPLIACCDYPLTITPASCRYPSNGDTRSPTIRLCPVWISPITPCRARWSSSLAPCQGALAREDGRRRGRRAGLTLRLVRGRVGLPRAWSGARIVFRRPSCATCGPRMSSGVLTFTPWLRLPARAMRCRG